MEFPHSENSLKFKSSRNACYNLIKTNSNMILSSSMPAMQTKATLHQDFNRIILLSFYKIERVLLRFCSIDSIVYHQPILLPSIFLKYIYYNYKFKRKSMELGSK